MYPSTFITSLVFIFTLSLSLIFFFEDSKTKKPEQNFISERFVNSTKLGKRLSNLGYLKAIKNPNPLTKTYYDYYPSSQVKNKNHKIESIDQFNFYSNCYVVSFHIDPKDIYDEKTGIIATKSQRGRKVEKLATLTIYSDKKKMILPTTQVGIRFHGGTVRADKSKFNHNFHLRAYLRKSYGTDSINARVLYSNPKENDYPINRLVFKLGPRFYPLKLASKVSKLLGDSLSQDYYPMILYINRKKKGFGYVTEFMGTKTLKNKLKHSSFYFFKRRSRQRQTTFSKENDFFNHIIKEFKNPLKEKINQKKILSFLELSNLIDFENYFYNTFTFIFCGTTDWFQGALFLNLKHPHPKWQWLHWDLDHSFFDYYPIINGIRSQWNGNIVNSRKIWEQESFAIMTNQVAFKIGARARILKILTDGDPNFKPYYVTLAVHALNHTLTPKKLLPLLKPYEGFVNSISNLKEKKIKKQHQTDLFHLKSFMQNRQDFVRKEMQDFFSLGKKLKIQVKQAPFNVKYKIDHVKNYTQYTGFYFKNNLFAIEIQGVRENQLDYWLVNGKKINQKKLQIKLTDDLVIKPIFKKSL